MKIYVGTDHRGFSLVKDLVDHLKKEGYDVKDDGDLELKPEDDFPLFARRVVNDILASEDEEPRGILLCGSGQGMCMAANRFKGIRACLGWSNEAARSSRNDDDSNVLCLPADVVGESKEFTIVDTWLKTPFADAVRYRRRLYELDNLDD